MRLYCLYIIGKCRKWGERVPLLLSNTSCSFSFNLLFRQMWFLAQVKKVTRFFFYIDHKLLLRIYSYIKTLTLKTINWRFYYDFKLNMLRETEIFNWMLPKKIVMLKMRDWFRDKKKRKENERLIQSTV